MLQQVGRFLLRAREKGPERIAVVIAVFVFFGGLDFVVEWVLDVTEIPLSAHGVVDGFIVGAFAALITWALYEAARKEKLRIRKALESEAQLNHEIRNALEVIGQAGYLISDVSLKNAVSESVHRIDSILKQWKPPEDLDDTDY